MTNDIAVITEPAVERDENLILKFRKPYVFEHETYTEIDLSGLEEATAEDLCAVGRIMAKKGVITPSPELDVDFWKYMASRVCHMPIEFFESFDMRDATRLKNLIMGYLYSGNGEEQDESLIVRFRKAYIFEGEPYTEIDLSGLEVSTAGDLCAVGRILAKSGVITPMPEIHIDFWPHMAARVCRMPVAFFKRLDLRDAVRLKNVVTGFIYGGDGEE